MSDLTDWIMAVFTVVLAGATIALAWATCNLVKTTKEVNQSSEKLQVMPWLSFGLPHLLSDSKGNPEGEYSRFPINNIGLGNAKIISEEALRDNTTKLRIERHSPGQVIEKGVPFLWDVYGVKADDEVSITIKFSDLKDHPYSFSYSYIVK